MYTDSDVPSADRRLQLLVFCCDSSPAVTKDSPCDDSVKGVVLAHEKSEESDYRQGILRLDG